MHTYNLKKNGKKYDCTSSNVLQFSTNISKGFFSESKDLNLPLVTRNKQCYNNGPVQNLKECPTETSPS